MFYGAFRLGNYFFNLLLTNLPQVMSMAASLTATRVYYRNLADDEQIMAEPLAWAFVGGLSGAWLVIFSAFLLLVKREYLGTFFSLQTGYQYVQSKVQREGDECKSKVFRYNKKMWKSIRPEVKQWCLDNWELWEEEKPAWFNDAFKASVDDDMIPKRVVASMNGGGSRRRSTVGERLGLAGGTTPGGARVAQAPAPTVADERA